LPKDGWCSTQLWMAFILMLASLLVIEITRGVLEQFAEHGLPGPEISSPLR